MHDSREYTDIMIKTLFPSLSGIVHVIHESEARGRGAKQLQASRTGAGQQIRERFEDSLRLSALWLLISTAAISRFMYILTSRPEKERRGKERKGEQKRRGVTHDYDRGCESMASRCSQRRVV